MAPGGEFTIELKSVSFFSFHGLHEEERKTGNEYLVDLSVKYDAPGQRVNRINDTVNYVRLFEIVREEMKHPRDLLETIAELVAEKIHREFPMVKESVIHIQKKNPPITNFSGNVAVTYRKQTPNQ